jgi:hypothetical protein
MDAARELTDPSNHRTHPHPQGIAGVMRSLKNYAR